VHYDEDVELLKSLIQEQSDHCLICYTPAIPSTNLELKYLLENGFDLMKRSEVLGLISQDYFTIAVAGTHGKTTTSSIVAHILNECKGNCIAFLGGISLNFNSNLLLNEGADILVVEADEYDRSFLTLSPNIALITSLDADHLDIYGDGNIMEDAYKEFAEKIKSNGSLITKKKYVQSLELREDIDVSTYGIIEASDTYATSVKVENGIYVTNIDCKNQEVNNVEIGLPGIHNVENSIGAFAIADKLGLDHDGIKKALASYRGVKRRFEYHIKRDDIVYIDDYAHHPSELEMCINSVKELYPNKKVTGIFQPHLFSRTRDFAAGFAESLSLLDELILMEIYPARELPIEGVSSQIILDQVNLRAKKIVQDEDLLECLENENLEILLTLGAGDIDVFVKPIAKMLGGEN